MKMDGETVVFNFQQPTLNAEIPEVEGATITFSRVDLIIATAYDSTAISGTKGTFLLDKNIFIGEGGKFDWSAAGLDPNAVFVNLDKYSFNTRNPYWKPSMPN